MLKGDAGSGMLGAAVPTSPVGNIFCHQGLTFDQEKASCQNRERERFLALAHFQSRDPLEFVDGANLYTMLLSNPLRNADSGGLLCGAWGLNGVPGPEVVGATRLSVGNGVECYWKYCIHCKRTCGYIWPCIWDEYCDRCGPRGITYMPTPPVGGPVGLTLEQYCAGYGVVNGAVVIMPGGQPPALARPTGPPCGTCPP